MIHLLFGVMIILQLSAMGDLKSFFPGPLEQTSWFFFSLTVTEICNGNNIAMPEVSSAVVNLPGS